MGTWLKKRRSWLIGAVAVILVATVAVYWFAIRPQAANAQDSPTTRNVAASTQTLQQTVSTTGTITPLVNDTVTFAATGTVKAVDVKVGDTVSKGQRLATIDTLALQVAKAQAKSDLETAKALYDQAVTNATGTAASDAQIASYKAQVAQNQEKYDQAKAAMDDATLVAPDAGQVTAISYEVGDQVTASASSGGTDGSGGGSGSGGSGSAGGSDSSGNSGSTAGITIVGTSAWQVTGTVDSASYANVKKGLQAEITVTDTSQEIFGVVSSIDLIPDTSSGVAAYPVTIKVTGTPEGLHDGMSAKVAIVYQRRTGVLVVPSLAISMSDGQATVKKVGSDGKTTVTPVTTGESSGQYTEITGGLAEGDEVQVTVVTQKSGTSGNSGRGGAGQGGYGTWNRSGSGSAGSGPSGTIQIPGGGQMPAPPAEMGGQG